MVLLDKVKCKGFYKKVHDGKALYLDKENLKAYAQISFEGDPGGEEVDYIEKTYFEHVDGEFSGVIVGFKDLVVKSHLEAIYQDPVDVGIGTIPERFYVSKTPIEVVKCAIVYYANNKKHYVPLDEITKEGESNEAI